MLPKCFIFSVPARARTVDPLIKSQLLYQLSYRDIGLIGNAKLGKNKKIRPKFSERIPEPQIHRISSAIHRIARNK